MEIGLGNGRYIHGLAFGGIGSEYRTGNKYKWRAGMLDNAAHFIFRLCLIYWC